MKLYKNLTISFLTAILTIFLVYGGYTIYAAGSYEFSESGIGFSGAYDKYHGEMNDFFNGKMEKLNNMLKTKDFYKNPDFSPPKDLTKCDDKNVSTYCVSMGALDRYIEYVKTLDRIKGTLENSGTAYLLIENILSDTSERNEKIDMEYEEAKKVMEGTVASYNEFRLAYPMHQKYAEVIKYLIKYRLSLKDVRKRVARFPEKFIDATSSQCK